MSEKLILIRNEDCIGIITINRPHILNTFRKGVFDLCQDH